MINPLHPFEHSSSALPGKAKTSLSYEFAISAVITKKQNMFPELDEILDNEEISVLRELEFLDSLDEDNLVVGRRGRE